MNEENSKIETGASDCSAVDGGQPMDISAVQPGLPSRCDYPRIAEWIRDLCLMFGTTLETAYIVAGHFVGGLRREHEKQDRTVATDGGSGKAG